MSKQFESIMRGLQQVADYKNGDKTKCRVRTVAAHDIEPLAAYSKDEIRAIRHEKNFTQKDFAEILGVNKKTVEAWEAGTRKPTGTAVRLFQLMEKDPNIINHMVRQ
ncbi:MAG: helix-turn-helix domain-containing protein [Eubacterium sp.]|nr:helix-turn-helix domain-containing protein [Eubacterium sp.]